MKYRIFKSAGAFNGAEISKAELVAVQSGQGIREVSENLIQAVKTSLNKLSETKGCSIAVSPPVDDGYSQETGTRFLSMRAIVESQNEKPLILHYDVIETAE